MSLFTLSSLSSGESARVAGVDATASSAKRLADLGFVPGVVVRMLRAGMPCIVSVDQTRLGLGRALQYSIMLVKDA